MGLAKRTARLLMVASIWLVLAGAERVVLAQCQASELLKLGASDAAPGDLFGFSVSVAEDVAIVGAPLDDEACAADPDCDSGAAYVYRLIAGGWVQEAQLTASDAAPGDMFGFSVSASGYVAVIGAIQAEAAEPSPGAAYVFRFDGSGWSEEAKLVASDGAADDAFGFSVSASGDVAVIGAYHADQTAGNSGAAYVYRLDDTGWQEEAKLTASDADVWDTFGFSVSIDGTIAVIGAPGNEDAGPDSGSAYIYRRSTTSWVEKAKLTASDGAEGDEFGHSVCVSDQGVVVGSWQDDSELSNAGSAYVFRFDGSDWIEEATLTASIPSSHAYFGNSVCLDGDVALIGSHRNDSAGPSSGSAYAYRFDGVLWHEVAQLTASDADAWAMFGISVSLSSDIALIGACNDGNTGSGEFDGFGSAYVFRGLSDCNTNGTLDICDIADGTSADENGDGIPDECEPIGVPLDIKPGSCPNPLNRNSHGVLPVALIGTEDFDATKIDVSSVVLSRADGVGGEVAPNEGPPGPHSVVEDVATPFDGEACGCHDLSGDSIDDLVMKFRTDDVVAALELDSLNPGDEIELVVTGSLIDGTEFTSSGDCILIVPPGPANLAITSNAVDVFVNVAPADLTVDGGGFPAFDRSYDPGTAITLTAPASAGGRSFRAWTINGVLWTTNQTVIDVTIIESLTARALYRSETIKDLGLGDHQGSPAPFER